MAQTSADSVIHKIILDPAYVDRSKIGDIRRQEPINGTYIYSGKKNEIIDLTQKELGLAEKYGRQIFAKIPGVFVYDMDGTGNQINISARGLDPHRGWEFNQRKDGILTNSDMYGYPASHYNMPLEAVERIEMLRGTGSLQYGAQFGGMLNYVSKAPDSTKKFHLNAALGLGSFSLLSGFFRASGTIKKFQYNIWYNNKSSNGYRQNSRSHYSSANISLFYHPGKKTSVKAEYTRSNYVVQLAGPLTDSMFQLNPRMSTRARNYYNPDIHITSLTVDLKPGKYTLVRIASSLLLGARNSVMFDKPATVADTVVTATNYQNNRQVDIDHFNSFTTEIRVLQKWMLLGREQALATGIQLMNNDLHRQQLGKGSTGEDFDIDLRASGWGRDLHFKTKNRAFFAENRWAINNKLSINTGLRIEYGQTNLSGTIVYYKAENVPNAIPHRFPLFGTNLQYNLSRRVNVYGGWSQAYRPVIFKDIIPASVYEYSDKNLKDAYGYNAEMGIRGQWKGLKWDISAYQMMYKNRLGTLALKDSLGNILIFRTNIGNSLTRGLECFLQWDIDIGSKWALSVFSSTAYTYAVYQSARVKSGNANIDISGNRVESTPALISRNGFTLKYNKYSLNGLYSYTSSSFADALNTRTPSVTGASGIVPAYGLLDLNFSWRLSPENSIILNLSNALNRAYFTKRPQFYPGPGIWPSDGRSVSITLNARLF
ncbi:MAG: TonB-dependent receptor [Bacteroidetes bacterium]|nr:TonB-dependent receptor [Bacteroidota bacterium]